MNTIWIILWSSFYVHIYVFVLILLKSFFPQTSIPQTSSITGVSPSDCFMSFSGHSLAQSYTCAEMKSVYSSASCKQKNSFDSFKNMITYKLVTYKSCITIYLDATKITLGCFKINKRCDYKCINWIWH